MPSPFYWLDPVQQVWLFWTVIVLIGAVYAGLASLERMLKRRGHGIVAFELAGSRARADAILAAWGEEGRMRAAVLQGLDYLFLLLYPLAIGLGCVMVAHRLEALPVLAAAGMLLAWAQFGAALLDAVENYALIRLLFGDGGHTWAPLARRCALVKFAIVLLGIFYVLAGYLLSFGFGAA